MKVTNKIYSLKGKLIGYLIKGDNKYTRICPYCNAKVKYLWRHIEHGVKWKRSTDSCSVGVEGIDVIHYDCKSKIPFRKGYSIFQSFLIDYFEMDEWFKCEVCGKKIKDFAKHGITTWTFPTTCSKSCRGVYMTWSQDKELHHKARLKQQETMRKKGMIPGFTYQLTKYGNESSYEDYVNELLKEVEIRFRKPKTGVSYFNDGEWHKYYPDFVLPDTFIKGYNKPVVLEVKSDFTYKAYPELVELKLKSTLNKGYPIIMIDPYFEDGDWWLTKSNNPSKMEVMNRLNLLFKIQQKNRSEGRSTIPYI